MDARERHYVADPPNRTVLRLRISVTGNAERRFGPRAPSGETGGVDRPGEPFEGGGADGAIR
ncbi:hypothetical protein GCM10009678_60950 [Actinomadura kijaniata]